MNIFLVEDSPSIRRLLVRRLDSMSGMRVVGEAAHEAQALALIEWTHPDLVLLDLSLASGSGLQVLGALRQSGFRGRIAVLTSQALEAYRQACLQAGADAFYDKASGLETLFDDLAELVEQDMGGGTEGHPSSLLRDGLTGLFDGTALFERLDQSVRQAQRDGEDLAVYVLRMEGLDKLVALHGQVLAESLIREAALRLRHVSGDADIVARRGENSFTLVLTRLDGPGHAAAFALQLGELMAAPYEHDGRRYQLPLGLGMALFPADAVSARGLLTLAEATAFGALQEELA
ncbi:response regulator [Pelomonas sp. SE-A7]|uniref:response regulator n=1 Tax=Pelomonas sp. SE-A7 TaxID=3054953 RepID=UPI00259CCC6D|nr:response regulator [Pelomonas sp. SE-A7]MDM4767612.1 response regulator [Pelomonas sp. SE-A7]